MIWILLDYLRMVAYTVIVLSSLRGIFQRKFDSTLFIGDIVMAGSLFFVLFGVRFMNGQLEILADWIVTPAAIIWAAIHFMAMIDGNFEYRRLFLTKRIQKPHKK